MRQLFLTLAVLVAGMAGSSSTAAAEARTLTDDAGRTVTLPGAVSRVFTAGPPAAILLYTLAPEMMLGWPRENRMLEKAYMAEPYASLPATGRLTGRGSSAGPETILALGPDLILDVGSTRATFADLASRVQAQTGIPYILLSGRFEDMAGTYRSLGRILGVEARAEALAAYTDSLMAEIDRRIAALPASARPRVYYGRGPDGLETGLAGSINTEIIERVGAVNVAAGGGSGGLAQVSLEQVLAWNPDVIITTDPHFFQHARTDPRWSGVAAVQAGRVHLAPKLPFGWVDFPPGVNRLIGARWLASILYPDLFPEDIRPIVQDFYKRFYHVELSPEQADQLLSVAEAEEVER
ncbi:iron ABC transporter substrate-binding protein [Indioceanicola profundi]|uniref:iron ABC transporter substrate-binding protein n=1 Tax=Indioceanicola profundi TaxID=2220096 RepID=UPI000E6AB715|nr:iron ABC transporter substrate-binding protein [Indioceanicola profundi]